MAYILDHDKVQIALVDICLPGAHDAGMYTTQHCTAFADRGNTQTQYLPMKQQLEAGLRIFDVRPWYYEGEFYAHHSTHCDGLGCKGDKLINMLQATKEFLDMHPELVVIELSHYCHTSQADTAFINLLNRTLGERIYREEKPNAKELIKRPLREIVPPNSKTGKVILLMEGMEDNTANRSQGLFNTAELHTAGGWSNDNKYELLKQHQITRLTNYSGNGNNMYEWAWQITQHDGEAVKSALAPRAKASIRNGAYKANMQLSSVLDSLVSSGVIHKGKIPNILWSDFADTMVVRQCIRLSTINLNAQ
jgi:hypothetical protein